MNLTLLGSFLAAIVFLGAMFFFYEKKKPPLSVILMTATLCALGAAGRILFQFIPQVQPVTGLVIIAGLCIGPQSGFLVGALSALTSNMALGQGPWTPWQMLAWGLIGILAGIWGRAKKSPPLWAVCLFSFFAGLLFSVIMDIYTVASFGAHVTLPMALSTFGMGLLFNISHAVGNVVFILLLYRPLEKKILRVKGKYEG